MYSGEGTALRLPLACVMANEPWPPSCGGDLARSLAAITLGVGPTGGVWPSCSTSSVVLGHVPIVPSVGTISGGSIPLALFAHSSSFGD
jgi:hypothetical protein